MQYKEQHKESMAGLNDVASKLRKRTKPLVRLLLILWALAPGLYAAAPWDAAFAKDTRAALEAAQRVSSAEDTSVVVLLEEHRYVIDREGRTASTLRKVYRILKEDAVEDWASVEQDYQPWYEQIPQIRAHGWRHALA